MTPKQLYCLLVSLVVILLILLCVYYFKTKSNNIIFIKTDNNGNLMKMCSKCKIDIPCTNNCSPIKCGKKCKVLNHICKKNNCAGSNNMTFDPKTKRYVGCKSLVCDMNKGNPINCGKNSGNCNVNPYSTCPMVTDRDYFKFFTKDGYFKTWEALTYDEKLMKKKLDDPFNQLHNPPIQIAGQGQYNREYCNPKVSAALRVCDGDLACMRKHLDGSGCNIPWQ